jgi:putative nucleotidyltransferase with HDIG domain
MEHAAVGATMGRESAGCARPRSSSPAGLPPARIDVPALLSGTGMVLGGALRSLDRGTRLHLVKVSALAGRLASALGLPQEARRQAAAAGLLHDVGKSLVPRDVLLKPTALDPVELEVVRTHPVSGEALAAVVADPVVLDAIRHHHERLDGAGYPDGLSAGEITDVTRIVAVADAYDALTSDRPYQPALSVAEACLRMTAAAGTHLDPDMVEALVGLEAATFSFAA